jgi:hypothetical protein
MRQRRYSQYIGYSAKRKAPCRRSCDTVIKMRTFAVLVSLGAIGCVGFFLLRPPIAATGDYLNSAGRIEVPAAILYWQDLIAQHGPAQAYGQMVNEALVLSPAVRHELAHTFGAALYEVGGMSYAKHCGLDFIYGCYHQILGLAMADYGLDGLVRLNEACLGGAAPAGSCAHGAGHALLSYYGYDETGLKKAHDRCILLYQEETLQTACAGGLVMEYNQRQIVSENLDLRDFTETNAHTPCLEFALLFQKECAYQNSAWWYYHLRGSLTTEDTYQAIGTLCRQYAPEKPALVAPCFAGAGFIIADNEDFKPKDIASACGAISTTRAERLFCLGQAAQTYRMEGISYQSVCRDFGLSAEELTFCEVYAAAERTRALEFTP